MNVNKNWNVIFFPHLCLIQRALGDSIASCLLRKGGECSLLTDIDVMPTEKGRFLRTACMFDISVQICEANLLKSRINVVIFHVP